MCFFRELLGQCGDQKRIYFAATKAARKCEMKEDHKRSSSITTDTRSHATTTIYLSYEYISFGCRAKCVRDAV
jgi:hypothetical protein